MNISDSLDKKNLFLLLDLLKDKGLDATVLLIRFRRIAGEELLENYEMLLKNNYVDTKNKIVESIKLEVMTRIGRLDFSSILSKDIFVKYIDSNLNTVTGLDITKYKNIVADEINKELLDYEFIESMNFKLYGAVKQINAINSLNFLTSDLKETVKLKNEILESVNLFIEELGNNNLTYIPIVPCIDGNAIVNLEIIDDILDVSKYYTEYNKHLSNLKNAVNSIEVPTDIATNLHDTIGNIIFEFTNDTINIEDFDNKCIYIKNLIDFYLISFDSYKIVLTRYISLLETYQNSLNEINYVITTTEEKLKNVKPV